MERDKDEMQRLTEMLNDPNAEFQDEEEAEEVPMETETDPNLIENEITEPVPEPKRKKKAPQPEAEETGAEEAGAEENGAEENGAEENGAEETPETNGTTEKSNEMEE